MSGFEIAGIVLGVIPLAIKSYGTIGVIFRDYRDSEREIRKLQMMHLIQRNQFRRSIRTLLSGTVDDTTLSGMLEDTSHPQWTDDAFRRELSEVFGKDIDTSEEFKANVELIHGSLLEVHEICSTIWAGSQSNSIPVSDSGHHHSVGRLRVVQALSDRGRRLSWALSKKGKIEPMLISLGRTNRTLEGLVNDIRRNRKRAPKMIQPGVPFEDARDVQLAYTQVYRALAAACSRCDCASHGIDLALESSKDGSIRHMPSDYDVVLHFGPASKTWHITLTYTNDVSYTAALALSSKETFDAGRKRLAKSALAASTAGSSKITKPGKTVGFKMNTARPPSSGGPKSRSQTLPVEPSQNPVKDSHQEQQTLIPDLCAVLKGLESSPSQTKDEHISLGYLGAERESVYKVHLAKCEAHLPEISQSLNQILSGSLSKNDRMSTQIMQPYQRLRLAYVLAASLLRLYSSPWLQEQGRWNSSDIRFFPARQPIPHDGISNAIPHLSAGEARNSPRSDSVAAIVKNYQIYALGIVLLEIAVGKPVESSGEAGSVDDETKEFLAAMRLDKEGAAAGVFGPLYGDIVSRCLMFKFNTSEQDLSNVGLQRAFYTDVVCQLEGCLNFLGRRN
ncbi:MAG: hypothetical protein M1825_003108 [Sarcosagium campestre]|nr:MAG: hypothetical protein M1825_003108 [Sarcosagium campestre]